MQRPGIGVGAVTALQESCDAVQGELVYQQVAEALQGALYIDHSTSVAELGSLFEWQDDKPLQRLKREIAAAYGAAWSFPSTNGTTILNILALLSACPPGGRVLVNRDAHISVTAGLIHGDLRPVYVVPEYDADLGLSLGPTLAGFKDALNREPVDCVFLTSPNYFGITGELAEIVALAHERGLPVVVDAAHAPHFHFCEGLPDGAEDLGADLVCQSTHKVGSALSQASLLLIGNESFIPKIYEHVNDLGFVSTSFSYPILASLEFSIRQFVEQGESLWNRTIERANAFRRSAGSVPGISCFGRERAGRAGFRDVDPTRVTLDVSRTGLTGFQFSDRLVEEQIYPEMATLTQVLFLFTPGTAENDARRLLQAVRGIAQRYGARARVKTSQAPPPLSKMAVTPRAAKFASKEVVRTREANGRVSGETVATYPPGVPIIAAGEIVSGEAIEYLLYMRERGATLKGASDPSFQTLK
ncbi:MAG: aminotransferase class I/II-fold pyridoxal phosphate-dependent enzyme, partial [Bryobacteraceae bacterium]